MLSILRLDLCVFNIEHNLDITEKVLCVIPARLRSTRLPEKPLALIGTKPMIQWTYESAVSAGVFSKIIVATDDKKIADVVRGFGGYCEMTPETIRSGTDRAAFVSRLYPDFPIVVNLQGDEPFVPKGTCEVLLEPFRRGLPVCMSTVGRHLSGLSEYQDAAVVKVLRNKNGMAIYFSRSPIPYLRDEKSLNGLPVYAHLGLYAFKHEFLLDYSALASSPLENAESLEQLRAIENGFLIYLAISEQNSLGVNTPEELENVIQYAKDKGFI